MKKVWIISFVFAVVLCGCATPSLETVSDVYVTQPPAEIRTIHLQLPEDAAEAVMEGAVGARLYLCDGYELRLQTVDARSIDDVLQTVTGYTEDRLTVMKTRSGEFDRYDLVWCTAGEEGEQMAVTSTAFPPWQTAAGPMTCRKSGRKFWTALR